MPRLNQLPGKPQVWLVGNQAYIVYLYDFDFIDGEIPVAFTLTKKELDAAFGARAVTYDRKITESQFNAVGALDLGTYNSPAVPFENDPMTEWLENFEKEANVRPWLNDPEVAAVFLGAYLQGRDPTDAEFENTEWWQTHSKAQRDWLLMVESDPATAAQMKSDARLTIADAMRSAGINDPGQGLVNWLSDQFITGNWTSSYLNQQILRLSDRWAPGKVDKELRQWLDGRRPNQTQLEEDRVKELYDTWLGPMHGKVSNPTIAEWAGKLRNDPDAEQKLIEKLQARRMVLFPNHLDPTITYDEIANMWRQEWASTLGTVPQEAKDKAWIQLLRINDAEEGGEFMRKTGIARGSRTVSNDALNDTMQAFSTTRAPI